MEGENDLTVAILTRAVEGLRNKGAVCRVQATPQPSLRGTLLSSSREVTIAQTTLVNYYDQKN